MNDKQELFDKFLKDWLRAKYIAGFAWEQAKNDIDTEYERDIADSKTKFLSDIAANDLQSEYEAWEQGQKSND